MSANWAAGPPKLIKPSCHQNQVASRKLIERLTVPRAAWLSLKVSAGHIPVEFYTPKYRAKSIQLIGKLQQNESDE
jgi:hypothetical protein